jgi:hypothetical protein
MFLRITRTHKFSVVKFSVQYSRDRRMFPYRFLCVSSTFEQTFVIYSAISWPMVRKPFQTCCLFLFVMTLRIFV